MKHLKTNTKMNCSSEQLEIIKNQISLPVIKEWDSKVESDGKYLNELNLIKEVLTSSLIIMISVRLP